MQTKLPPLLQATSAAFGSVVGNTIVFPLDAATTRLQHDASISPSKRSTLIFTLYQLLNRRNGLKRMYSGLTADTLSTILSSFIYFYTYTVLQKDLSKSRSKHSNSLGRPYQPITSRMSRFVKLSPLKELVIGIVAGIISKGVTLPISTICVRKQICKAGQDRQSLLNSLVTIFKQDGLQGLFSGLGPTIPLTLLPSFTLYIHSLLLRMLIPVKYRAHPAGSVTFILGALSNALATIPLYPLVLVKVLSQSRRYKGKEKEGEGGVIYDIKEIVKREGFRGLYVGLEGQLTKGVVQQAVMMLIKQRVEEIVVQFCQSI
ncbi:hypothetical protein L204_102739 [Cryptococcus depauperatus]